MSNIVLVLLLKFEGLHLAAIVNQVRQIIAELQGCKFGLFTRLCAKFDSFVTSLQQTTVNRHNQQMALWILYVQAFCNQTSRFLKKIISTLNDRLDAFLHSHVAFKSAHRLVDAAIDAKTAVAWRSDVMNCVLNFRFTGSRSLRILQWHVPDTNTRYQGCIVHLAALKYGNTKDAPTHVSPTTSTNSNSAPKDQLDSLEGSAQHTKSLGSLASPSTSPTSMTAATSNMKPKNCENNLSPTEVLMRWLRLSVS